MDKRAPENRDKLISLDPENKKLQELLGGYVLNSDALKRIENKLNSIAEDLFKSTKESAKIKGDNTIVDSNARNAVERFAEPQKSNRKSPY